MFRIGLFLMAVVALCIASLVYTKKWLSLALQKKEKAILVDSQYAFLLKSFITLSFFIIAFVFGFLNQGVNIIPLALFLFFAFLVAAVYRFRPKIFYPAVTGAFFIVAFLVFNCAGNKFYFFIPCCFSLFGLCCLWLFIQLDKISFLSLITTFAFIVCFFLFSIMPCFLPFWQGAQLYLLYFLFLIFLAQLIIYKATYKMMLPRLGKQGSIFIGFILICYTLYLWTRGQIINAFVLTSFYWVEFLVALCLALHMGMNQFKILYTPERKMMQHFSFPLFIKKVLFVQIFLAVMACVLKNSISASCGVVAIAFGWFYLSLFISGKPKVKVGEVFKDVCGGFKELANAATKIKEKKKKIIKKHKK